MRPPENRLGLVPSDPLEEFLLHDNRAARLLTGQHIDDGTGRCSVCSQGGQVGHVRWPCQLASAARSAAERLARRRHLRLLERDMHRDDV
jgi:hypothetical protein